MTGAGASHVLVVGTLALDDVTTPSASRRAVLGGSGMYAAYAARHFGPTDLVAAVGHDFPAEHWHLLLDRGIELRAVERVPQHRTMRWRAKYGQDLGDVVAEEVEDSLPPDCGSRLVAPLQESSYVLLANQRPELQSRVLQQLSRPRLVLLDSRSLWISERRQTVMQLLDRTNGVLLNAQEARQLTEERSLAQAATQLHRWGSGIVVIKRGARGALLSYQAEKMLDVPAFAVDGVKDPSGAGDSFAGAFIGSLSRAQELDFECFREALVAASVMASFCVEGFSVEGLQQLEASTFRQRWAWLESHAHLHRD